MNLVALVELAVVHPGTIDHGPGFVAQVDERHFILDLNDRMHPVGLRVVDTQGRPPGAGRAFVRSVLAMLGIGLLGLGAVPIFLDPALVRDKLITNLAKQVAKCMYEYDAEEDRYKGAGN